MPSAAARSGADRRTDPVPPSQSELVEARTLTDAPMLVAGSLIGSGIAVVFADVARMAA